MGATVKIKSELNRIAPPPSPFTASSHQPPNTCHQTTMNRQPNDRRRARNRTNKTAPNNAKKPIKTNTHRRKQSLDRLPPSKKDAPTVGCPHLPSDNNITGRAVGRTQTPLFCNLWSPDFTETKESDLYFSLKILRLYVLFFIFFTVFVRIILARAVTPC